VLLPQMIAGLTRGEAKKRAVELLGYLGLQNRLTHRPAELSGGEQQRVAIARAVANAPRILLADEPTGNLDSANAANIADLMFRLRQDSGMTLILVTHDEGLAARCRRRVRIKDGLIVEDCREAAAARPIGLRAAP
jgi:lipoprotein-releasing system ATP-binding protein